ncbi:hypothetical protein [Methylibium rhizosphaerae]|uniref:hypothetical protein n=1 Tax=Methylibium rhizosphaerae TaxID=2570323 RepID=UPI00112923BD|nr:hypothetical protein [Methylibium rhizosphaerae]
MFSAMELTQNAVDGFTAGIRSLVEQRAARAEMEAVTRQSSAQAWADYAKRLERERDELRQAVSTLLERHEQVRDQLNTVQNCYIKYTALLVSRVKGLDETVQRKSANEYAYEKLREHLVQLLQEQGAGDAHALTTDDAQVEFLKMYWDYFMEHNDVRQGVPTLADALKT